MDTIYSLEQVPHGQRIALYGAGEFGKTVKQIIDIERPDIVVTHWIDTFKEFELMGLCSITLENIDHYLGEEFDHILITSSYDYEISESLAEHGITQFSKVDLFLSIIGKIEHRHHLPEIFCFDSVAIELTAQCNMKCTFCPSDLLDRSKKQMNFELYKRIVDDVKRSGITDVILFTGGGEPLLYKRFREAIAYAHGNGFSFEMFTNGLLLTTELYHEMAEHGLKNLNYSFHNFTPETFEHRYPSPSIPYEEYRNKLFNLVQYHLENGFDNIITIKLMVSKDNWISGKMWDLPGYQHEADNLKEYLSGFLDELGQYLQQHEQPLLVDSDLLLSEVSTLDGEDSRANGATRVIKLSNTISLQIVKCILSNERVMTERSKFDDQAYAFNMQHEGHCMAMQWPTVSNDGYIIPCCSTPDTQFWLESFNVGNYNEGGNFESALSSEKYVDFINAFKRGILKENFCKECMGYYTSVSVPVESLSTE